MTDQSSLGFLYGGGEMGERIRALDWSSTPLGPVDSWPQSLRSPLSMLLSSKASIMLFWGPEYVSLYNDAYRPVFGAKHPEMLGKPGRIAWSEIWETRANLRALLDGVVQTGNAFSATDLLFLLERNGYVEETYFDVSYDPVRIESGEVGGVFCIVTETTGRVVGERRLALLRDLAAFNASARNVREAAERAIDILSSASQDISFALVFVNGKLQAATPGAEQVRSTTPPSLVQELSIGNGQLVIGVHPYRPLDEQHRTFLKLVADQITTAIANAQAYEDQLRRAEALAELDRAKTAFFGNVSHEFRTPLTLMLGPVEDSLTDAQHPLPTEHRERLEVVRRNALRLQKMVNGLLDFSRIEAGRIQAVFEPTDLSALTSDLASTFRSAMEKAGLRFVLEMPRFDEPVYVDRGMWEKIVLNLVSNAYKFTLAGEIAVSMRVVDRVAELTVRDTGSGIPADELPHVFERFHRVEGTRGRTQEGTGIGLALVQELVKLHGGEIIAESSPNVGSTFRVRIPLGTAHLPSEKIGNGSVRDTTAINAVPFVEEALRWIPAEDKATPVAGRPTRGRILLADDNADMRDYVSRLLREQHDVITVGDGEAALVSIRSAMPDLVVADVMMPRLDGFALLASIRSDSETRSLPVILLSARAGEEARIEGMDAGADDYLVKPFSARDLLSRVGAHLEMSRVRRMALERERLLRNEAEAARRQAEVAGSRMREVFEQAPALICTLRGPNHVFESANAAYLKLVGHSDIIGRPIAEVFPDLVFQGFIALLDKVYAAGRPYTADETPVHFRSGSDGPLKEIFINFVYQPLFDDDRAVSGILFHGVDVTDSVLARRLIEQQTAQLREARARAEAANEAKAQFLATMSHELRTPLNAIMGYTDLLDAEIAGPLVGAQRLHLERINLGARHLLRIIEEILTFSRIEAGREEVHPEPADLVALAVETCRLVEPLAAQKQLILTCDTPDALVSVTDPNKVRQILLNLLSNAIKFTARGEVRLTLKSESGQVVFAVSDTGVGIAPDQHDRVFEAFYQLQPDPGQTRVGTGLGLTVSRELARLLGGDLRVDSTIGTGSIFTLTIPAQISSSHEQSETADRVSAAFAASIPTTIS